MAVVKNICYLCKGRGSFQSYTGMIMACLVCHGDGYVMEPEIETKIEFPRKGE